MSTNSNDNLVIEALQLEKTFRDFWMRPKAKAVNGVSFSVKQGEVIGFLGPNGSGKSTTIKMILGLLYPSSGFLKVLGRSPSDVAVKRHIGYLPEETYLYKYLTAAETLDFFGALFNLPSAERKKRTHELLKMVGLSHAAHRPVGEFSKGMARRIGLAQALINDPDLIILDEPTSGLDPLGCQQVKDIIRLLAQRKKTIILCSHLLADVEDVCDSVMIMYGGKIRAEGPLSKLLTVSDRTRIETPALTRDQTARVMALLNEFEGMNPEGDTSAGKGVIVDNPKLQLEDFFMDVVNRARRESPETSGATSEGRIADYLTGGKDEQSAAAILQSLSTPENARRREAEASQIEAAAAASAAPAPNLGRLQSLAAEEPAQKSDAAANPGAAAKGTPELSAAEKAAKNRAIQDLLKK